MDMNIKKEGQKLTITVELDKTGHPSSSGKTTVLYSSGGFAWTEGIGINLTVIKSKKD